MTGDEITQSKLKELLNYNPDTGIFTWLISPALNVKIGSKAGVQNTKKYIKITILCRQYSAHRLAWLYVYGTWPNVINHKNNERNDNKIDNLESVTQRENAQRMKIHIQGKLVGAIWRKKVNKWQSRVYVNKKSHSLGLYETELEAHNAYMFASSQLSNGLTIKEIRDKYRDLLKGE